METITIHKAKTQLSRLIKQACRGEEIVIAGGKEPVVKVVPITQTRGDRQPGALRGKIHIGPEFFEPLSPEESEVFENFMFYLAREEFDVIPVTVEHGIRAGLLPGPHQDPFDRMLIAQALAENVPLVSNDRALDGYGVKRFW